MRYNIPLLFIVLLPLLCSSCTTTRHVSSVTEVRDTTHIVVHDTIHVVQVRDSMIVKVDERIHETETTIFDPETGHPVQHQVLRDIERNIDAQVQHLVDSIMNSLRIEENAMHQSDIETHDEQRRRQAALSPFERFVRSVATLGCFLLVISLAMLAFRFYSYRPKS